MSRNHVAAMMSVNGSLCLCSDPSRMLEVTDSLRQVLVVHVAEVDRSAEVQMMEVEVQTVDGGCTKVSAILSKTVRAEVTLAAASAEASASFFL